MWTGRVGAFWWYRRPAEAGLGGSGAAEHCLLEFLTRRSVSSLAPCQAAHFLDALRQGWPRCRNDWPLSTAARFRSWPIRVGRCACGISRAGLPPHRWRERLMCPVLPTLNGMIFQCRCGQRAPRRSLRGSLRSIPPMHARRCQRTCPLLLSSVCVCRRRSRRRCLRHAPLSPMRSLRSCRGEPGSSAYNYLCLYVHDTGRTPRKSPRARNRSSQAAVSPHAAPPSELYAEPHRRM